MPAWLSSVSTQQQVPQAAALLRHLWRQEVIGTLQSSDTTTAQQLHQLRHMRPASARMSVVPIHYYCYYCMFPHPAVSQLPFLRVRVFRLATDCSTTFGVLCRCQGMEQSLPYHWVDHSSWMRHIRCVTCTLHGADDATVA